MTKPIEAYPRVAVVEELSHESSIAWLRPFALIEDRYTHRLPDAASARFGVTFETLLAQKGLTQCLALGDAFRTYNPYEPDLTEIIGEYVPQVDTL